MEAVDFEKLLPLEEIRQYTRTDDDGYVSDSELKLLRKTAFELLEKYAQINLRGVQIIDEEFTFIPCRSGPQKIVLKYPVTSPFVTVTLTGNLFNIIVPKNVTEFYFYPNEYKINYCALNDIRGLVSYQTGERCVAEISAAHKTGILKYIKWELHNKSEKWQVGHDAVELSGAYFLWVSNITI